MKLKIAAFLAAWLFIVPLLVKGQDNLLLTGEVKDQSGRSLPGATVSLLRAFDQSIITRTLTDTAGIFRLPGQSAGNYYLQVTLVGFENVRTDSFELKSDLKLPDVTMVVASTALKGVNVSASRPYIEQKIDRTIVNPEALISNAGGTALDVLEKAPGVVIDQNGAISLKGKSVTIFIDDKPSYLSGEDLQNYLRSINASAINQLELMTNPPAKYDAAGNGGIINIRTKKNKANGFNGGMSLNYMQGRYGRTNDNFNFNYRNGKLNVFGNLGYNYNNAYTDLTIKRHFFDAAGNLMTNFTEASYIRNMGSNYSAKIGADYYLSDKSTLGVNFTGIVNPHSTVTPVTSRFSDASGTLDSIITAANNQQNLFRNWGTNINYRHQYKKDGPELSADLDYLNYYTNSDQSFNNQSFLANGAPNGIDLLTGNLPAHINIYTGKVDYTHPLPNGIKLETGLKSSYTNTDNLADYFNNTGGPTLPDYDKTNHFLYRENINAAYLNASRDYKRFSFLAGLRLENTHTDGHQLGNPQKTDSSFSQNYTSLFPTAYVQYKADTAGHHILSLNYGRRIDRPYYQDLNPFLSPLDKFTYYTGNPFLNPSFANNIELSHSYLNRFTTTLNYSRTRNDVDETIEIVNGIYYSMPGNIGKTTTWSLSFDGTFDPAKWFNIQFHGHVAHLHSVSDFYTGLLDSKGTFYFLRPVFSFKPGNDWTLQLDGSYQSKVVSTQFVTQRKGRVNCAIAKKLSASATLKLVANDIFHTAVTHGTINNLNQATASWVNINDSQSIVLSFSYRFGKAISDLRRHDANGAESERNRVKD